MKKHITKKNVVKLGVLITFVALITYVVFFSNIDKSQFTVENIKLFFLQFGIFGPIVFIIIYASRPVVPIIPPLPIAIAIGALYGALVGTIIVAIGATGAAILAFSIARFVGHDYITSNEGKGTVHNIKQKIETGGWASVMIARFLNIPWDIVSYASGLSQITFRDFLIGTIIPAIPLSFIAVYFGSVFEQIKSVSDLLTFGPLSAILIFAAGIIVPILLKKRMEANKNKNAKPVEGV